MLIVGDREAEKGGVSVRHRSQGDLGFMKADEFSSRIVEEINNKKIL